MKITFDDFKKAEDIYEFCDSLTDENIKDLKSEIDSWTEKELQSGINVLNDYYGLKVPVTLLKELLKSDIIIAYEVYSGGVSDTDQRSQLCELILYYLKLPHYPLYVDSDAYKANFKKLLIEAALNHSIVVEWD